MHVGGKGLNISTNTTQFMTAVSGLLHQYYDMAFLQIPHSALPEKNSKDPPPVVGVL